MRTADIARSLIATLVLGSVPPLIRAQATQTFIVHGTPRSCSAITQMDSALAEMSQQYFAGWNEKDYADAQAWSQACADYGWHVPGRSRPALLQAQHDRALGAAAAPQTAVAQIAPNPQPTSAPAQPALATAQSADIAAPIAGAGAIAASAPPTSAPTQPVAAPTQAAAAPVAAAVPVAAAAPTAPTPVATPAVAIVPSVDSLGAANTTAAVATPAASTAAVPAASSVATPAVSTIQAQTKSAEPLLASAAPGIPLTVPAAQTSLAADVPASVTLVAASTRHDPGQPEEDSLVTDDFFKKHFHQESLWVANRAHLDIGADQSPSSWPSEATSAQLKNRLMADKIVLYCARKTNAAESTAKQPLDPSNRPLLWDWRWCESEEASAYSRLVSGNEFPSAGRGVVLGCASSDSYVFTERCIATVVESAKN
jgi:hypothetical protein